jgi:hypothetical protein
MSTLKVDTIESKTLNGDITVSSPLSGSGASLTSLPAANLTGTVADARISTLTASKLTGALPAISGASLTNLPSSEVTYVQFPATQVASTDANRMDDYEEGTWTPAWIPTSGSWSGTFNGARYVKIGKVVWASMTFTASAQATGTKMNGMSGLPFTSANHGVRPVPSIALTRVGLSDHQLHCRVAVNNTTVDMGMSDTGTSAGGEFYPAHTSASSQFSLTLCYEASA